MEKKEEKGNKKIVKVQETRHIVSAQKKFGRRHPLKQTMKREGGVTIRGTSIDWEGEGGRSMILRSGYGI